VKLATLQDGTRDGRLVVVSRDLGRFADATGTARTMQEALDSWERRAAGLAVIAAAVEDGSTPTQPFAADRAMAPLPRAYQWLDGSAYLNHVELARKARGAALPESLQTDPLLYQGGSDSFLGPRESIRMPDEGWGIDLEGEVAVVLGDVPMGASADVGLAAVRLLLLCNDVSLRNLAPAELAKGFGFVQSKPASAFSPVAVTPDELGPHWRDGRLHLPLQVDLNGAPFGRAEAGEGMTFDFGRLIAHAARTRRLTSGTLLGSGTVSNAGTDGSPGRPISLGGRGFSCIAEQRVVETVLQGTARTPFLRFGDQVRIEMLDREGRSIFGAIEQTVEPTCGGSP